MQVIKKDGNFEQYNTDKIISAVSKAAERAMYKLTNDDKANICNGVAKIINEHNYYNEELDDQVIPVRDMHVIVEKVLLDIVPKVGECYRQYRNYKQDFVHMLDEVYTKEQELRYIGDVSNANTDSTMVSTQRSITYGLFSKEMYKHFFMTIEEIQATKDGYIYIHDMNARRDSINCCLFRMADVLSGGFEMGNIWYNEPKTLDVAFDVIGDVTFGASSQQYGGFTIPRVDTILAPYAEKSYQLYVEEYYNIYNNLVENYDEEWMLKLADEYATNKVRRDFEQGFQAWEYKFNTVGSSRGDYPSKWAA